MLRKYANIIYHSRIFPLGDVQHFHRNIEHPRPANTHMTFASDSSHQDSDGNDGPPISLRSALQQVERTGLVDYEVAGHSCARPAQVCQNPDEADRLGPRTNPGRFSPWDSINAN